jgi:hypothetical protein
MREEGMTKPMIENSDRGITVNKTLAWTIVTGVLAGGFYMGSELASTSAILQEIKLGAEKSRTEMKQVTDGIDARLRSVETSRASDATEIAGLRRDIGDFRSEVRELTNLLRDVNSRK